MAANGGEEVEYESDPEESMLPLAMRRREASDDEEGEGEDREKLPGIGRRIRSDCESDDQGGAPVNYDEESDVEGGEEEEEEEEEELIVAEEEHGYDGRAVEGIDKAHEAEVLFMVPESGEDGLRSGGEQAAFLGKNQVEDEKKENEPYAVPTAGAFYMHDDRFRDSGVGRHRRTPGGRKLWESKDVRKWGHDKFEELSLQETNYNMERRNSRGRYRGRGKNRGTDRGYSRVNSARAYNDSNSQNSIKVVKGRGPRRYEPPTRSKSDTSPMRNKQYRKFLETTSNASSGKVSMYSANVQSDPAPRKNVFASSLSSASPPFYPSGSSKQDVSPTPKKDAQAGSTSRSLPPVLMEENFSVPHSNSSYRGKTLPDPMSRERLYIDESIHPIAGKPQTKQHLQSSRSSSVSVAQSPLIRAHALSGQVSYQSTPSHQVIRASSQTQTAVVQQRERAVQSAIQPYLQVSTQKFSKHSVSGSQASSLPKIPSTNSSEHGETESPTGSSKARTALVGKGKGAIQGNGKASFLYSGAQVSGVTGTVGVAHGDQNFAGNPTILPVMQFGGQHPGGLGVPAVGMAFPGYVAQPQHGFGNSEMTWLPVLASAAGALGASYCSPYFNVDGGYYARSSGQASSSDGSSKEMTTNKPTNGWKPPEKPELVNDEYGQRQNKPRRYSEMNFGQ